MRAAIPLFLSPCFGRPVFAGCDPGFSRLTFPGGEEHIKLDPHQDWAAELGHVQIVHRVRSSAELMQVLLANDAVRRMPGVSHVSLYMPYFPGQQQDRVMVPGEPLTVKVVANLINSCGFSEVAIYDPHSDVTPGLVNNCRVITNHAFVAWAWQHLGNALGCPPLLVTPDAGAKKKLVPLCKSIGYTGDIAFGDKARDLKTGQIIGQKLYYDGDLTGVGCLIVDDIIVGGRTFIELAKKLRERGAASVHLAVSHGVLKSGFAPDAYPGLDGIYVTDSYQTIPQNVLETGFIKQFPLNPRGV